MRQSEDELVRTFVEHIRIGECSGYGSILRNKPTNNNPVGSREARGENGARISGFDRRDDRDRRSSYNANDIPMSSSSQQHRDDNDPGQEPGDAQEQFCQEDDKVDHSFVTREAELSIHVYQLQRQGSVEEYGDFGSGDIDETVMMAHHWTLPCEELEGVWDR
jgi:hypothetical protein